MGHCKTYWINLVQEHVGITCPLCCFMQCSPSNDYQAEESQHGTNSAHQTHTAWIQVATQYLKKIQPLSLEERSLLLWINQDIQIWSRVTSLIQKFHHSIIVYLRIFSILLRQFQFIMINPLSFWSLSFEELMSLAFISCNNTILSTNVPVTGHAVEKNWTCHLHVLT
jgi:hypothetical protein